MALGLTLMVAGSFGLLFRQARLTLDLQPELATLRQDGHAVLDRIAADLARAGGGLPAEIPVFTDLDRAGDRNPDGLDFLTAPERLPEASFEPVVAFDGAEARLGHPRSRLDRGAGDPGGRFVVVFNDDEMTPRWAFGQAVSVRGTGGGGASGLLGALRAAGNRVAGTAPGEAGAAGAAVRIAPRQSSWHRHFRPSVDGDTFEPGSGGGLLERALQSVLGGAIEAAVPGIGGGALATLTEQVVGATLERWARERGLPVGTPVEVRQGDGTGLFGLGQPGLVPVTRIRYWVQDAAPDDVDPRRVLMRRVDEEPPQPVGYVEDLQVRYVTGQNADILLDAPPRFVGDMASATRLRDHVVRAVDVAVRVRAAGKPRQQGLRRERSRASGSGRGAPHPGLPAPGGTPGGGGGRRTPRLGRTHAVELAADRDSENRAAPVPSRALVAGSRSPASGARPRGALRRPRRPEWMATVPRARCR